MKKSDTKKETETKTNRSWLQHIWKSNREIAEEVKSYDEIAWYASPRYWAIAILLIQSLVGFLTDTLGWGDLLAVGAICLPLFYLIARGYRFFILLAIVLYSADKIYTLYLYGYGNISVFFWWFATICLLALAYRVENAKAKLKKDVKKSVYYRDGLIAVFILVILSTVAFWAISANRDAEDEVMYWKGFIYRNTDGLQAYCGTSGIDMKNYTASFIEQYANEVAYVDSKVAEMGLDPKEFYNQLGVPAEYLNGLVANHYDALQQVLISLLVIEQTGIPAEEFVWKDEYLEILPKAGFCSFLDLNPKMIQPLDSDFEMFSGRLNLLMAE